MFKKFRLASISAIFLLAIVLVACGGNNNNEDNNNAAEENNNNDNTGDEEDGLELGQEDLEIPYVGWARETVSTHILAAILEEVGYNVDATLVEAGPMFTSVAEGDADLHTSAWLPATHASYWEEYEDDLEIANVVLDEAPLFLAVPDYIEGIETMEDLKDNEEFGDSVDWEITGIDPGAGIMQNTEEALEEYGLDDWELVQSSEAAMLTELQNAIEDEEPIIVPLWKPHWIFGVEELIEIEDSKEIYGGDGDEIVTVVRKGLEEDAPAAYRIAEQYEETYEMVEDLMPKVNVDEEEPEDVAQDFLDENPDLLEEWTEGVN